MACILILVGPPVHLRRKDRRLCGDVSGYGRSSSSRINRSFDLTLLDPKKTPVAPSGPWQQECGSTRLPEDPDARNDGTEPMENSDGILKAVLRIHEAPLVANGWSHVLPSIAAVAGLDVATLLIKDVMSGCARCVSGFQSAPEHLVAFKAALEMERIPAWIPAVPAGSVVQSSSAMSDRDFSRSAFYNEIVRPRGTFYGVVAKPLDGPRQRVFLTGGRRLGRDDFDQLDVEALQLLVPHITTALQVSSRLAGIDLRAKVASEAIDQLDSAVILVDREARILFANRAAEDQLCCNEGLAVKEGRLCLHEPARNRALLRTITLADCGTISPPLSRSRHQIEVPRGARRSPLQLTVTPFRPDVIEAALPAPGQARPSAIILITDPDKDRALWKQRLREEFGLTAAETELALEIMKGDGRDAAAARLGITVATVRTHLLRIFDTTGVHRQAELVRLLLDRAHSPASGAFFNAAATPYRHRNEPRQGL